MSAIGQKMSTLTLNMLNKKTEEPMPSDHEMVMTDVWNEIHRNYAR